MTTDHPMFARLLWIVAIVMICGVLATVVLTNTTLRSIENKLPIALFKELDDLSSVLDNLAEVVKAAEQTRSTPTPDSFNVLRAKVDLIHQSIVALRKSYVFDNLVQASAFHAVVAPAISDLKTWLNEGVSGYAPQAQITAAIMLTRIDKAYQKARVLNRSSKIHAQSILIAQGRRIDRFLIGVNILFALTSLISLSLVGLLIYQLTLHRRQRKIMNQLRQTQETLRESEQRFRRIYEHVSIGIARVSLKFIIENANDAYCRMLGYSEDELIGKHLKQITHPEAIAENMRRQLQLARGDIDHYRMEKQFIHKSGATVHGILDANLVRDVNGHPHYFLGSVLDVTEQKALEMRLQQAQKLESIGNLAGGIAHDFNNILFPIVGMSELLLEDLPQGSQEHENAQEILKAGFRGRDLVKQILAFSRRSEPKMMPIRLQPILSDVMKLSRSTIPSNIQINVNIEKDVGMVMADPTQLHQIAMNLVTNALHAVESNGGCISVQLEQIELTEDDPATASLKPGRYAMLAVSDTGCGMSPDIKDKIFEPYFTTKKQGKGTGLGLAVVYGIIRHCGGDITVTSEEQKGSTFRVCLPLLNAAHAEAPGDAPAIQPTGSERILLVDDEISIAQLEKQMLERLGYHVTILTRGIEAIETFKADPGAFDLIISDMTMPEITGDRLAKKIIEIRPDMPIIVCTGFSERINRETAVDMGISGLLMKPIKKSKMAQKVRHVLDAAGKTTP